MHEKELNERDKYMDITCLNLTQQIFIAIANDESFLAPLCYL